eukprot:6192680-Pleurochrysis_carterae.AAC.1
MSGQKESQTRLMAERSFAGMKSSTSMLLTRAPTSRRICGKSPRMFVSVSEKEVCGGQMELQANSLKHASDELN